MGNREESTTYRDLGQAMNAWKPLSDRVDLQGEVIAVIDNLSNSLGAVSSVHIPASAGYIAVTFAGEPGQVGAYVNKGHIDHIIEVAGSIAMESSPGYWRTNLSSARF